MKLAFAIFLTVFLAAFANSNAQEAVPVGKGAYAADLPSSIDPQGKKLQTQELYLVKEDGRPIPTNKWWTQLVVSRFAKSLWVYPLRVDPSEKGLDLYFPIQWDNNGQDPACELPLHIGGKDFTAADARAKDWSDWLVSFRMGQSNDKYFDVTVGEGMPCTWLEYHGVEPVISVPTGIELKFFDLAGNPGPLPARGDGFGIKYGDRQYAVFAPDETRFQNDHGDIGVAFAGKAQYLVICPLPSVKDIALFHRHAFAIPRNTEFSWKYDAAKGAVTTTFKVTTEALKGTEKQVIQGWLPHHYRQTTSNIAFNKIDYLTPRGPMHCAAGNEFAISYPYNGILPNLPAPKPTGQANDYDAGRMNAYLTDLAGKPKFGADTYWGGKDILRYGQCALMAKQINSPTYQTFVDGLRGAMADWFTYRPGKTDHFFCYYPRWKALVGVKTSYGSEGFNDHHFHYGYFTFASGLLAMNDPQYAADYGPMATLVGKEYANWDRTDTRFPFLRTFDVWQGHSWAGGTSSPGGENQESSSEAVQSWAGLIFLGEALGDKNMRDAGVMGYALESRATMEYWFDIGGDVFPPQWKHPVTGMVWSGGKIYGTYFTGDPAWIYGIQWLPASPMLSYLVRDPAFAAKSYENMCKDYESHEHKKPTIKNFGPGLGGVMLGYVLMYDPAWSCQQLDELWNEPGDKIAHDAGEMAVIYYQAHAMRNLGAIDWTCRGSSPTSMVYKLAAGKADTYIVWNPTARAETVTFYAGGNVVGTIVAPPQALTSANALSPVKK